MAGLEFLEDVGDLPLSDTTRGLAHFICSDRTARLRSLASLRGAGPAVKEGPFSARHARYEDAMLNTEPNIADFDGFYEVLVGLHRNLTPQQSQLVNSKLLLLLANHIGDRAVLDQAIAKALQGVKAAGRENTISAVV